ncbi:serpentine type 7TM GPCR chemoreceptor srt domain-containing protein [Ditylenchus destructor]|uniref:Serpentine type 7TM GPCR chemoreceptor srt domain-containing protein n=1 Tax=Ditylenchus destructor TaxID=166010 RepID=A0AAD4MNB8_9BILA|nr:serpentine type 7TM GPCR chemoreceptor srt domain-containing protein [Ditylenchus destructor]
MDPASIPPITNNFNQWPNWNFTSYYDVYCTNGATVPGERNILIGVIYIAIYLFFMSLYIPSLIVIWRSSLFQYACYKLMFCIGVFDLIGGFLYTFVNGIFSLIGANYCDNNILLIVVGHAAHGLWALFCISCVILALNRCVEIYSEKMADKLFGGQRAWFWSIPVLTYGALFSSNYDIPPIYNSVLSGYLFQIDFRPGAPPVHDWVCVANSCWVMASLIILYSLLLYKMRDYQDRCTEMRSNKEMQRKVMLQSFWICFCVFLVAGGSTSTGFIRIPDNLVKYATMALQLCSVSTSIVYLTLNKTIRRGVKDLLTGKKGRVSPDLLTGTTP